MVRQRVVSAVIGVAVLAGLVTLCQLAVRALFDESYLELYLRYGAFASLAVVLVLLAWSDEAERLTALVSAHPFHYVAAHVQQYARQVEAAFAFHKAQAGYTKKPVTFTAALAAALVFVLGQITG